MTGRKAPVAATCPPDHAHGKTVTCYVSHRCKCPSCRAGVAERARLIYRLKAYGQWNPRHPVAPVLVHLLRLQRFGYSIQTIARVTGLADKTIEDLLHGRRKSTTHATARAILSIEPDITDLNPHDRLRSIGLHRRLQALACNGWTLSAVATTAGIARDTLRWANGSDNVTVRTHTAIAAVYEQLWNTPAPADTPFDRRAAEQTRRRAAASGWLPPMAWDDIDTDETPDLGATDESAIDDVAVQEAVDGQRPHLTRAERHAALTRLHPLGHWDSALADLLCVSVKTIERDREHLGLESNYITQMRDVA